MTFSESRGATRAERKPSAGGGPGWDMSFDLKARRLATAELDAGSLRSGASTTVCASDAPRDTRMVWER